MAKGGRAQYISSRFRQAQSCLSGFHECALAAFDAAAIIFPDKKVMLQCTATSTKLHKVLGVETPVFAR